MRILMQTKDKETEQRFLCAVKERDRQKLCVLHTSAQVLERLFREPFDAMILDTEATDASLYDGAVRYPKNLFLLLPAFDPCASFSPAVVYGFLRSAAAHTVLDRVAALSVSATHAAQSEQAQISAALQAVGVPAHLKGFALWKDALRLVLRLDPAAPIRMEEDVYALLADSTRMSVSVVEHAMRHAIEAAWLRADARVLERTFGYTVSADRATPSNAAFLFQMQEHIRIDGDGRIG